MKIAFVLALTVAAAVSLVSTRRLAAADELAALEATFQRDVEPFLKTHCLRCHNEENLTSGVRVDHLNAAFEERHLKLWGAIQRQIAAPAMPPEDEPQPSDEERRRIGDWIERGLRLARSRPTPKNGSVRRLTVAQYRNTLRELLLLEDDLADVLPADAVSRDGFVNNQETLAVSPLLLEAYFDIAEKALARSIVDPKSKPTIENFRVDLGAAINPEPCPDKLILGADSLLLENADFIVTQLTPKKPFAFEPFRMRTKYRFIEGYEGNATVRGWREYDSIYHSVFACMRGTHGYPKGQAYSTVPQGLLLRPAIPSAEVFGVESTYGPRANFKISLRELPDEGRFRVTVTAAKCDDGLLLDQGTAAQAAEEPSAVVCRDAATLQTLNIPKAGIYQVDVHAVLEPDHKPDATPADKKRADKKPAELTLALGERQFSGTLEQPAFLAVRLPEGPLPILATVTGGRKVEQVVLTPLAEDDDLAQRFLAFEKRLPRVGVHVGLRRDCGSTLTPVGSPQTVSSSELAQYVFEGAIRNFPSPDVEKDNVNYLAGMREIGVRSEYTDGRDMPRLLVRSIEFEGPLYETWPPPSHANIFVAFERKDDRHAYARHILRTFATRAFRRPITDAEESALVRIFEGSYADGHNFYDSVKDALLVVLTSPQFLLISESSSTPEAEPLDDYELASKLSYFLWNGPPDDTLLKLAAEGSLHRQLDAEVQRLIADLRFARFTSEFASQWLALEKFAVLEPDRERYPKLTRDVRSQLRREPIEFFEHLIRNNLPARNFIDSDFVLANEVVASYYDLAEKPESGFEFVPIRHGRAELGGVLAQAAILAGLSDGRESNPVKRGAWLARRIIAEPPDDPPPNVPMLKEESGLTLRQRLEQHRNQPGCAQCHSKIDPWGLPLEQFDAGGRLKPQPVDAHSTLPDKTEIDGANELKRYLAEDRLDQVAFSVLKHLTVYATGRSLTYNELEYLRREGQKLKADDYRLQDMIRFVVRSPMFLEK